MKKWIPLLLIFGVGVFAAGCESGGADKQQMAQPGDYEGPPGGAGGAKTPDPGGSPTPPTNSGG